MGDNGSPHRTQLAEDFPDTKRIFRMNSHARSPDLNPLEHIWDVLRDNLLHIGIHHLQEL